MTALVWAGYAALVIGVLFALIGSIGVVRLPDFYTRAHAATKPDTLGVTLSMLGIAMLHGAHHGVDTTVFKLLLIMLFVAVANPAAAHALGRAAVRARLAPWLRDSSAVNPRVGTTPPGEEGSG